MALIAAGDLGSCLVWDMEPGETGDGEAMEFRLLYDGPLHAESRTSRLDNKHEIRRAVHPQLRELWRVSPHLNAKPGIRAYKSPDYERPPPHTIDALSERFARCGFNFVPLVTKSLFVYCELEVLLLKPEPVLGVRSWDIDNRLKTLFDGLQVPRECGQLPNGCSPLGGEDPFFCLLENDDLITRLSVETGPLLKAINSAEDVNRVHLTITVRLRPIARQLHNMAFG
jgi:hypothetical protein